jgi:two-component system cell cycle response regulator CtrA
MKVLVIEGKESLRVGIKRVLTEAKMTCDGIDFSDEIGRGAIDYDILVLNMELDGQEVLNRMRHSKVRVPVLVLSREKSLSLRVKALDAGADDFLNIPFHASELIARLRAVHRRSTSQIDNIVKCGKLTVNFSLQRVEVDGQLVSLTGKQFALFSVLCERKNKLVSKGQILSRIYEFEKEPQSRIVDAMIFKIRKKLGPAGKYITTVHGRGFRLVEPQEIPALKLAA